MWTFQISLFSLRTHHKMFQKFLTSIGMLTKNKKCGKRDKKQDKNKKVLKNDGIFENLKPQSAADIDQRVRCEILSSFHL